MKQFCLCCGAWTVFLSFWVKRHSLFFPIFSCNLFSSIAFGDSKPKKRKSRERERTRRKYTNHSACLTKQVFGTCTNQEQIILPKYPHFSPSIHWLFCIHEKSMWVLHMYFCPVWILWIYLDLQQPIHWRAREREMEKAFTKYIINI